MTLTQSPMQNYAAFVREKLRNFPLFGSAPPSDRRYFTSHMELCLLGISTVGSALRQGYENSVPKDYLRPNPTVSCPMPQIKG